MILHTACNASVKFILYKVLNCDGCHEGLKLLMKSLISSEFSGLSKFPLKENCVVYFISRLIDLEFYPYMQTKIGKMSSSANLPKVHFYMNKITDLSV